MVYCGAREARALSTPIGIRREDENRWERRAAPLDVLVGRLQKLAAYRPGVCDMVALENRLMAALPDGRLEETRISLLAIGVPWGDSAMSRTVALPAAIVTRLLLEGAFAAPGVQIPVARELYRPLLDELESLGIALQEQRTDHYPSPLA